MCWTSKNIPEVKIAKEDIKTFKVLSMSQNRDLYSYFFMSDYSIGEIKPKVTLHPELVYNSREHFIYRIHRGYHSYDKSIKCKYYNGIIEVGNLELYNNNRPLPSMFLCIVECTIPKDTKYCLNEIGEYVSEQIIIDKILEEY